MSIDVTTIATGLSQGFEPRTNTLQAPTKGLHF